jgi:hypothetical protein
MSVHIAGLVALLFTERYLYYILGCEMWFVLCFIYCVLYYSEYMGRGCESAGCRGGIWEEGEWSRRRLVIIT